MASTRVTHRIHAPRASVTTTLADVDGGTELLAVHDGLPRGVPPEANEQGWREALEKLAALVETR